VAAERSYSLREAINNSFDGYEPPQTAFSLNSDLLASETSHGAPVQTVATAAANSFS